MGIVSQTARNFKLIQAVLVSLGTNRHLLKEFVLRDIKGRFAGSFGGILWAVIKPLITIVVYFVIFSYFMRIQVTAEETGTDQFAIL